MTYACEKKRDTLCFLGVVVEKDHWEMASKAYVASMTVTELKQELKQRGLSTRGSKKSLRDRLERAFDEEELDDSSSENETGQIGPAEAGFNFSVPAESFLPADQIREDSPVLSPNSGEKMIISVELSNKETLEVYSPKPPSTGDDEGGGGGGVEDGVPNDEPSHVMAESTEKNHIHSLTVTAVPENSTKVQSLATTNEQNILQETQSPAISTNLTSEVNNEMVCDSLTPAEAISVSLPVASKTEDQRDGEEEEEDDDVKEDKTKDEVMNEPSVDRPAIEDDDGGSVATQEEVSEESVDIVSDVNPEPGEDVKISAEMEPGEDVKISAEMEPGEDVKLSAEMEPGEDVKISAEMDVGLTTVSSLQSSPIVKDKGLAKTPLKLEEKEEGEEINKSSENEDNSSHVEQEIPPSSAAGAMTIVEQANNNISEVSEQLMDVGGVSEGGMDDWVVIENPQQQLQNKKDVDKEVGIVDLKEETGTTVTEVKPEVSEPPQTVAAEEPGQEPDRVGSNVEPYQMTQNETEIEQKPADNMELDEKKELRNNDVKVVNTAPPQMEQQEKEMENLKEDVRVNEPSSVAADVEKQFAPDAPTISGITGQTTPTEVKTTDEDTSKVLPTSSCPPGATVTDDKLTTNAPSETQEVSEGVSMEVAVLVHAEEDDLSVFSTEAAEAQKIASSSSARGKVREKVRDRERDKSVKNSRRASGSSSGPSVPATSKQSAHLVDGTGSNTSSKGSNEAVSGGTIAWTSSPSEETKHNDREGGENQAEPTSKKRRRVSAHVVSSSTTVTAEPASIQWGGGEKRRRWGSGKQRSASSTTNINSDVLKDIIPSELEVGEGEDMMEVGEGEEGEGGGEPGETRGVGDGSEVISEQENMDKKEKDEHQLEWEEMVKGREAKQREIERARQELETRQRIEARVKARLEQAEAKAKKEEEVKASKRHRSPSPALNSPSNILHVEHLTRPFTLVQLKQLLADDGPLLKDGFWTNNVKSHCIAVYASKETAITTRRRLHGLKWPSTNPKLLAVDFLSLDQVQKISEGDLVVMEAPPDAGGKKEGGVEKEEAEGDGKTVADVGKNESVREEEKKMEGEPVRKTRRESSGKDKTEKKEDKENETKKADAAVADHGKKIEHSEPATDPIKEKGSQATKLLDDLFRKTKATPSIYWLPLSEAEVQQKQQEREVREAEREKRRLERQKMYEEERKKEKEREEAARKERERKIQEERERRARERVRRRSKEHSRSRSRSRSHDRYKDRDRRRR